MKRLTATLREQMGKGHVLDAAIEANLKGLGYGGGGGGRPPPTALGRGLFPPPRGGGCAPSSRQASATPNASRPIQLGVCCRCSNGFRRRARVAVLGCRTAGRSGAARSWPLPGAAFFGPVLASPPPPRAA